MYMSDNFCTFHTVNTRKRSLKFIVVIISTTHYHGHICVGKTMLEKCAIAIWFGERSGCDGSTQECVLNCDILVIKYEGK
jgi:hypothetical protein